METALASRWYVRCRDCLTVAAVETPHKGHIAYQVQFQSPKTKAFAMQCSICKGDVEIMGKVVGDPLVGLRLRTSEATIIACDSRCTGAHGPSCDCVCGGANHGTNAVRTVVTETGIPRIQMVDDEKARLRAIEWRTNLVRAKTIVHSIPGWYQGYRIINLACAARTHAGRMKKIAEILERLSRSKDDEDPRDPDQH